MAEKIENEQIQREYLAGILTCLDIRLQRAVKRWQLAGQDPEDRFRGLRITYGEALELTRRRPGEQWGSQVVLPENEESLFDTGLKKAEEKVKTLEKMASERGVVLRLKKICEAFRLSEFEWWAFIVMLAPALDLRYERIYGFLQDDVTRVQPSVDLALTLLLPEGLSRLDYLKFFEAHEPLRLYHILLPGESNGHQPNSLRQTFQAAPQVASWLMGTFLPRNEGYLVELTPWSEDLQEELTSSVFEGKPIPSIEVINSLNPIISLYGDDLLQQDILTRCLASAAKKPFLKLNLTNQSQIERALEQLYTSVRDARLMDAMLFVQWADVFIDENGCLIQDAFEAFSRMQETVILGSRRPFRLSDEMPGNDYPLMRVPLNRLSSLESVDLWNTLMDGVTEGLPDGTIDTLAGQFRFTTGQIMAAASDAMSMALQENRKLESKDLFEAARFHSGHALAGLAHKIEPRYFWDDLVLPETPISMLHEMVGMIRSRPRVLETWGLGRKLTSSLGVSALFTGPPGTGKTLAAQIIASELGIDLYRIDLSTVVSKYIGETEKNLERIFNEAQTSNAILFFDEADAIFGKRSEVKDAHDRYANIEVGYLLQRMEAYDGVAILATNLRANLDEAFTRRLQFIINFPFPEEMYRQRIWEVLMPPGMPRSPDLDLKLMANRFKLSGGSIRNCIVTAAFLAVESTGDDGKGAYVEMRHLMHGVRREFQKMGKLVQDTDFLLG